MNTNIVCNPVIDFYDGVFCYINTIKRLFAMVSEKEVLEMFNKFPEVPERFKEHLKSQIKWYTLNGERITYRTWLETIKVECEKYQDRKHGLYEVFWK